MERYLGLMLMTMVWATGCVAMRTATSPVDETVKAELEEQDCVQNFMGIAIGTTSVDAAKRNAGRIGAVGDGEHVSTRVPITHVRAVEIDQSSFIFFGSTCTVVVGENRLLPKSAGGP